MYVFMYGKNESILMNIVIQKKRNNRDSVIIIIIIIIIIVIIMIPITKSELRIIITSAI